MIMENQHINLMTEKRQRKSPLKRRNVPKIATWNDVYADNPPWVIGLPQPAIVELWKEGQISGSVLDLGCGTGENALFLAEKGLKVTGIDKASLPIKAANALAKERGLSATFAVGDALALKSLKTTFDTIIDSQLFHSFSDEMRLSYEKSLRAAVKPGGKCFILCCSNREPPVIQGFRPRYVTKEEISRIFSDGKAWTINWIKPSTIQTVREYSDGEVAAWLASISRTG